jgi:hypothetical protein
VSCGIAVKTYEKSARAVTGIYIHEGNSGNSRRVRLYTKRFCLAGVYRIGVGLHGGIAKQRRGRGGRESAQGYESYRFTGTVTGLTDGLTRLPGRMAVAPTAMRRMRYCRM